MYIGTYIVQPLEILVAYVVIYKDCNVMNFLQFDNLIAILDMQDSLLSTIKRLINIQQSLCPIRCSGFVTRKAFYTT